MKNSKDINFDTMPTYANMPVSSMSKEKIKKTLESFENLFSELSSIKDELRGPNDKFLRAEISVIEKNINKAKLDFVKTFE